jgi:creatinine amidohydrolase
MLQYTESFPSDLDAAWARGAPAILPIGALEWHGAHLPLGLDGLVAERFAADLAERVAGVLLPILYTPMTTLPHRHSLQVPAEAFRSIIDSTLAGLYTSGARTIAIVSGHYAQGHMVQLYEAAMMAMEDLELARVLAASPLELLDDPDLLDHAGRYETSQLLYLRPDLVRLDHLPESSKPKVDAVLGSHPSGASAEEGRELFARAMESWVKSLSLNPSRLAEWYGARFDSYQPYVDAYFRGSWEDAIHAWWETK